MPLRVTCSSASYDEDESFVVEDTPAVRRAVELRRQHCEAYGDGETELDETGSIVTHSEREFVDWVIDDIGDGLHDDEAKAHIYGLE